MASPRARPEPRRSKASRGASLVAAFAAALLASASGCGGDSGTGASSSSASGTGGGGGGGGGCPAGALPDVDGTCIALGVQGCADRFVGDDGICRPSIEACDAGAIPVFDKGCAAVGVSPCAHAFVGDDGLCHVDPARCPTGTYPVPQSGCVAIDGEDGCGSNTWGAIPDGAGNVYVDPSYTGGDGDGSKDKPFTEVSDALAMVPEGGRVALAAGAYHTSLDLERTVEIAGRCPSMVTIDGADTGTIPTTIYVGAGTATLRGLRIGGDGVGIYADAPIIVDGVVIDGALRDGIMVNGATADVRHVLLENTRWESDGKFGDGVLAFAGAAVEIHDSAFDKNHNIGLLATDIGTTLHATDVLVYGTEGNRDGLFGDGVLAIDGAKIELTDVAVVANHLDGLEASVKGSDITGTRVIIDGTLPQASDGYLGAGLQLFNEATMNLSASAIVDSNGVGILVSGAGTTLTLGTSLVSGTHPEASDGDFGRGIEVQDESVANIQDCAFVKNHDLGVCAFSAGTTLNLLRVLVQDTLPIQTGEFGVGAFVDASSKLSARSSVVSGGRVAGIIVAAGTIEMDASLVTGVASGTIALMNPTRTITDAGDGLLVMAGGTATKITGSLFEQCARAGLLFEGGAGALTASASTQNRFGSVVVDGGSLGVDPESDITGNQEQDRVTDGNFVIAGKPATKPQ